MDWKQKIEDMKKEKNAVILAHYYVEDEVQEVADYIGDSFYLSKLATTLEEDILVVCGVSFMGESVKILNPDKTVILPVPEADCAMAHMATVEKVKKIRETVEDVAVVCYINSTVELKAVSDVCVTSSNALNIVKKLPNKNIYFIPDRNLGAYIAKQVPEKNFILNDGYCPVHDVITVEDIERRKKQYPEAKVLAHPECREDVLKLADYIGSTSGIIKYASESDNDIFIIVTEKGVLHKLKCDNPDKTFISAIDNFVCQDMKKITLEKIYNAVANDINRVEIDTEQIKRGLEPLDRMLELA